MVRIFETPAPRLNDVLHYVIARTEGFGFGETKINKVIVRADVEHYRRYGSTITGATSFQKLQFGPVPNGVLKALKSLRTQQKIASVRSPTPAGDREEYTALVEPDLKLFGSSEVDALNLAIAHLDRLSATAASNETHDALWDEIPLREQIPVRAAAFPPSPVDQDVLGWALEGGI